MYSIAGTRGVFASFLHSNVKMWRNQNAVRSVCFRNCGCARCNRDSINKAFVFVVFIERSADHVAYKLS